MQEMCGGVVMEQLKDTYRHVVRTAKINVGNEYITDEFIRVYKKVVSKM